MAIKSWVGSRGCSDHQPIFLRLEGPKVKSPTPMKFNHIWLIEKGYRNLVNNAWSHIHEYLEKTYSQQFSENLAHIKELTKKWATSFH
jgi:hypothetical protein